MMQMEPTQQMALAAFLSIILTIRFNDIIDFMVEEELIPMLDYFDLLDKTTNRDKMSELLRYIMVAPSQNAFDKFLRILTRCRYVDLVHMIREKYEQLNNAPTVPPRSARTSPPPPLLPPDLTAAAAAPPDLDNRLSLYAAPLTIPHPFGTEFAPPNRATKIRLNIRCTHELGLTIGDGRNDPRWQGDEHLYIKNMVGGLPGMMSGLLQIGDTLHKVNGLHIAGMDTYELQNRFQPTVERIKTVTVKRHSFGQ